MYDKHTQHSNVYEVVELDYCKKLRFVSVSPISYLLKPSFLVNTTFCELLVRSSLTNHYSWRNLGHYEEGGKFLKKLWRASVLDYNRVI